MQSNPRTPRTDDLFRLDGENYIGGYTGDPSLRDKGVRPTPATASDPVTVRRYRDRTNGIPRNGNYAALYLGGGPCYLEYPYSNPLSGTGDFTIQFHINLPLIPAPTGTVYFISVQGTPITAANTAWAVFSGNAGKASLGFVYSDGTTRNASASTTADFLATGWYHIAVERFNGTVYLYKNGAIVGSFALASSLNAAPTDGKIRIGPPRHDINAGPSDVSHVVYYDDIQITPRALYRGTAFTPSTQGPTPYRI